MAAESPTVPLRSCLLSPLGTFVLKFHFMPTYKGDSFEYYRVSNGNLALSTLSTSNIFLYIKKINFS